jgi:hypothetical protein
MATITSIPDDRPLSAEETALVRWLLEHGDADAAFFLQQLEKARVASRCYCGCRSINFAIDGKRSPVEAGQFVLSDYWWTDSAGHILGVFVFASGGVLGGLEVYSADGLGENNKLPCIGDLRPIEHG